MNAFDVLDHIYFEKLAQDAPPQEDTLVDLKALSPKLREQVKISAAASKVRVPGGKTTPHKFVQRKNQERYQK